MSLITKLNSRLLEKNVRNTVISGLLLALSACAPPKPASPVDKPSTNNLPPKVTQLPKAMTKLGFELGDHSGIQYLNMPKTTNSVFYADDPSTKHVGYFSFIDYNPNTNIAEFYTSEGVHGEVRIDAEKHMIFHREFFKGQVKIDSSLYHSKENMRGWIAAETNRGGNVTINFDEESSSLTVHTDGRELYQQQINLPEGVKIKVPFKNDKFLIIESSKNNGFTSTGWDGSKYNFPEVWVSLFPEFRKGKEVFYYHNGNANGGFYNFQQYLSEITK